ncbi:MAG TPA: hypothetical protein VF794_07800 [Archangium sp.]|jgi:hypothetical protein|uniref:hypothetical protein n=1 Tax=Archangium sp. TaxID=1872627 RepID=UPI002ED9B987
MDEEKKAEASGDGPEQVGPYLLQEQVAQEDSSRWECYRATHQTSGAPALVYKPAAEDKKRPGPLPDFRAHITSSASEDYFALEVEDSPWAVAPDKHSVESLVCTFEAVRQAVGRLDQALHAPNEARPWWRLGLALSGAATVLVVALLPATLAPVAEVRVQEDATREAWATDVHVDPVPAKTPLPVKNQKRAPCMEGLEVEVSGVCWLPIEKRPCPPQTVAYQSQCLLPVAVPRPPVTSLDGSDNSESP